MKREEEKIKENEKIDKKEEINNHKKDKNIILIILWIIFFIALGVIIIKFVIPNDNDKDDIEDKKDNIQLSGNVEFPKDVEFEEFEGLGFYCSDKEYDNNTYSYEVGSEVYCGISFELSGNKKVKEIYGEFSFDENIEYIGIHDVWEDWNLIQNNNKFHLTTDKSTSYAEGFYTLKFKVKKSTKKDVINIEFKNLIAKTEDNKYYKFEDEIISLNINIPQNYKYEKDEEKNELVFYKYDDKDYIYKEVSRYSCKEKECYSMHTYGLDPIDSNNGNLIIYDGKELFKDNKYYFKNVIIYNFETGIKRNVKNISLISNGLYYKNYRMESFVLTNTDDKMAIIDFNGNFIKDFTEKKFTLSCYEGCVLENYSVDNDIIVTIKDGKYGIEKITSNDIVVEHRFEEIELYDSAVLGEMVYARYENNKYFKAKENGKWYLYSYDTKGKIIDAGYDNFYIADENIIVAYEGKKLYIKDYNGNNLTEDFIELEYGLLPTWTRITEGIRLEKQENKIIITVVDGISHESQDVEKTKYYNYEYNVNTKKITKSDKSAVQ